jgi:hypothetical protein
MKKQELDRIVLDYLRKNGYQTAATAFSEESGVPSSDSMAHHLDAEQALFSSVLFYNVAEGECRCTKFSWLCVRPPPAVD